MPSLYVNNEKKVSNYALKYPSEMSSAEFFGVFTDMIQQSGQIVQYVSLLLNATVVIIFYCLSGFYFAPYEMLIGFILLFVFVLPVKKMSRLVDVQSKGLSDEWMLVNKFLMNGLKNNLFLRINNLIGYQLSKVGSALDKYERHYKDYSIVSGIAGSFPLVVGIIVIALISFFSVNYIHTDPIKLLSFFYLFMRLSQSASEASGNMSMVKVYLPSLAKVMAISQKFEGYAYDVKKTVALVEPLEEVSFKNVGFGYSAGTPILEGISFDLKRGDLFLIKGESGRGKSTIINLMLGQLMPTEGFVRVNGQSTGTIVFFESISYVGPEPYLIPGTLRENLEFGGGKVDSDAAYDLLEKLALGQIFNSSNHGLDVFLNEHAKLSTGQKQRISICRALLKNTPLLILDEGTANLDEGNEKKVIEFIAQNKKDSIVVVVTHKEAFDRIATQRLNL
jgi:ABC-type bacteriocin/lantibiotic exporter with double-glycine peptidase domain